MSRFKTNPKLCRVERVPRLVFLAGLLMGIGCFVYYYCNSLTIAHYDAKAHLLVARRMVDSLEPGYAQLGVNWLPLIHLIYLPFVIFDSQYRSGFIPSLISVFAFALSGWLTYRIAHRLTGSIAAGVFAAAVLLANPNLQYLQSCPLTEPLYMALLLLALDSLIPGANRTDASSPGGPQSGLILGALCRYEGWYFFGGVLLLLAFMISGRSTAQTQGASGRRCLSRRLGHSCGRAFRLYIPSSGDNFFGRVAEGNPSSLYDLQAPVSFRGVSSGRAFADGDNPSSVAGGSRRCFFFWLSARNSTASPSDSAVAPFADQHFRSLLGIDLSSSLLGASPAGRGDFRQSRDYIGIRQKTSAPAAAHCCDGIALAYLVSHRANPAGSLCPAPEPCAARRGIDTIPDSPSARNIRYGRFSAFVFWECRFLLWPVKTTP